MLILWSLQWRHNELNSVPNHRRLDCLLRRVFRRRWKKTSKLCVTGFCKDNSQVTGEFSAQRTSNAENISIWCRHNVIHRCKNIDSNHYCFGDVIMTLSMRHTSHFDFWYHKYLESWHFRVAKWYVNITGPHFLYVYDLLNESWRHQVKI